MRMLVLPILAALFALPASAQTLERIKETNRLNLGFRSDAAPISFADEKGSPAGYTPLICVGVAKAIAVALELPDLAVSFRPVNSPDRFEKVASGEIDMLCGASTITLGRREIVDFSVPIYVDGTAVLLPIGGATSFTDLEGKKIGVRGGTTTETVLKASLEEAGINAETFQFVDHNAGINAMKSKEIDAYFADQSILMFKFFSEDMAKDFQQPSQILTLEKQGLVLPRNDADFRLLVDTVLSEMFRDGTIDKLFKQTLPGVKPGQAVQGMYLLSPTLP